MEAKDTVSLLVYGRRGLWTDPVSRLGGEKATYPVPTYEGLKGVLKSIYWKPTLIWEIRRVRVMKPIRTESVNVKLRKWGGGTGLSRWMYLCDPAYQVEAQLVWNMARPELAGDRNLKKHMEIFSRALDRGGRMDVFLGTRECQAHAEPCTFGEGAGAYDGSGEIPFGAMFHSFGYPGETGRNMLEARLWPSASMKDGVIEFPRPEDRRLAVRSVRPMRAKAFGQGSMTECGDERLKMFSGVFKAQEAV